MSTRIVVAFLAMSASAFALEVPFTVEEPIGAERKLEVVSGGIPFEEGKYKDVTGFSLREGSKEVPVQVSPMVKYPDGSLHWALVSFPVEMKAKETKKFTLKDSPGRAQAKNPVVVKEDGDVVEVSNGIVAFAVNKANFNGFEWVKLKGKEIFKAPKAGGVMASGKGGPCKPIHFSLYYQGPVRTTVYVKGTYGDLKNPTYSMAITLNAGESAIHIAHSIRNGTLNCKTTTVSSPTINFGLAGDLQAGQGGAAPGGGRKVPAFGWQEFTGAANVLVFMQHGGPGNKGLHKVTAADGEFVIHLNPAEGDYRIEEGAHKSTDISIVFNNTMSKDALSERLHARAACSHLSAYDGFGVGIGWGSLEDETQTYKNANWKDPENPKKFPRSKVDPNFYCGWFAAHKTSECDHLQGLVFGYVRTGQRGFLDQANGWARYWRTYLLWRSDEFVYGKDGRWRTPKWGSGRCCTEGCHFYGVGIFNYALITGDIDALEAAYDWAEMSGVAWYGPYAGKKPGDNISAYGSRGFSRSYLAVARAYDVARDKKTQDLLLHYVNTATKAYGRDPRGFTTGWSGSSPGAARGRFKGREAELEKIIQDEKIEVVGKKMKHPKYGEYQPMSASSWPEAMESQANYMAYEALKDSTDPACQLAAEDAMDYCIAESYLGLKYIYNEKDNCVYYYMAMDYPLPDDCGGGSRDSWYTKWWPNTMGYGYTLTGDKALKQRMLQMLWAGLSRDYVHPPRQPFGEAPTYSRVEGNTKGDWMTPTAFAFGVGARPKKNDTPPAAITDLKAEAAGGGNVNLTWTAPKPAAGKLMKYQVKYADKPMKDYMDVNWREEFRTVCYWNMAKNVVGEPVPQAPGKSESMSISVPAGKAYIAVRSFDDEHNRSKISNLVELEVK